MSKTLELIFENAEGRTARLTVQDPREDLTSADVQQAMDNIIAGNIFDTVGGDFVGIKGARIVTREVVDILP